MKTAGDCSALLRPHHWKRWRGEREEVMAEMKARMEAAAGLVVPQRTAAEAADAAAIAIFLRSGTRM